MADLLRTRELPQWIERIWGRLERSLPVQLAWEVQGPDRRLKLRLLMEKTEQSQCVELKDKVYGLLGLASDVDEGNIVIDYAKVAL
jgi:hypothetical protein